MKEEDPALDEVLSRCYQALSPFGNDLEKRLGYFIRSARLGVTEPKDVEGELARDLIQFVRTGGNLSDIESKLSALDAPKHFLDLTNEQRIVLSYHNLICMNKRTPTTSEIQIYIEKIYGSNFVPHHNTIRGILKKHRLPRAPGGCPTENLIKK